MALTKNFISYAINKAF